jgi:hypothetical protein
VLARGEDREIHLRVHGREREVDDDLDAVVREQLLRGAGGGDAELLRPRLRALEVDVRDEPHLEVGERREVAQVLGRDHPGADDADPHRHLAASSFVT